MVGAPENHIALRLSFYEFFYQYIGGLYRLDDTGSYLVRICSAIGPAIFQPALPSSFDGCDGDADGCAAVGYAILEFVDCGRFMFAGETQVVIRSVYFDVFLDHGAEGLTYFDVCILVASGAQQGVGEVGVHTAAVPIQVAQGFTMPVDGDTIFFT